jgi:hypothetical protein
LHSIGTPAWDATFYYAFSRTIVFDRDLRLENDLVLSYPTNAPQFAIKELEKVKTPTGRVASPFAIGAPLLWAPWLATLRLGATIGSLVGIAPADPSGYEWPFIAGLTTLSAVLGALAFWLAGRQSAAKLDAQSAGLATATMMLATPLLYYMYREPLYAHAASALVTTLVVLVWWRGRQSPSSGSRALALGALIGLAALVRWQHLVYLALPLLSTFGWWLALPAEQRRTGARQALAALALTGVATLLLFSIQLAQWRLFYGAWLTVPQGEAYVDWRALFLRPVLFSAYRGLLAWMPIFFPGVMGLLLVARRRPGLAIPMLAVLALETYVNSSTRDWFGGGGFGPRRYTSELAILLFGYAALLNALPRRARLLLGLLAGLLFAAHQWILLRFGLVERLGGHNQTMYPTYLWQESTLTELWQALLGHLPDLFQNALDSFVFGGSPLDRLIRAASFPAEHILSLLATLLFLALGVGLARRAVRLWPAGRRPWLALAVAVTSVLLLFDLWILLGA